MATGSEKPSTRPASTGARATTSGDSRYLAEPKLLPKGTKIHVTAHYDNSPTNKDNPDPTATVHYGDQTWDEMMAGYFTYTIEGRSGTATGGLNR